MSRRIENNEPEKAFFTITNAKGEAINLDPDTQQYNYSMGTGSKPDRTIKLTHQQPVAGHFDRALQTINFGSMYSVRCLQISPERDPESVDAQIVVRYLHNNGLSEITIPYPQSHNDVTARFYYSEDAREVYIWWDNTSNTPTPISFSSYLAQFHQFPGRIISTESTGTKILNRPNPVTEHRRWGGSGTLNADYTGGTGPTFAGFQIPVRSNEVSVMPDAHRAGPATTGTSDAFHQKPTAIRQYGPGRGAQQTDPSAEESIESIVVAEEAKPTLVFRPQEVHTSIIPATRAEDHQVPHQPEPTTVTEFVAALLAQIEKDMTGIGLPAIADIARSIRTKLDRS